VSRAAKRRRDISPRPRSGAETLALGREAALDISPGRKPRVSNGPETQALKGRQKTLTPFQGLPRKKDVFPRAYALGYSLMPLRGFEQQCPHALGLHLLPLCG